MITKVFLQSAALSLIFSCTAPVWGMVEDKIITVKKVIQKPSQDNKWTGLFTHEDNRALIKAANDGDTVAQDVMAGRIACELLSLKNKRELPWVTLDIIKERIAHTYGYLDIFGVFFAEEHKDSFPDIYEILEKGASEGNKVAQFNMGWVHSRRLWDVVADEEKYVEWFLKSAKQGFAPAQCALGIHHYDREKEALDWLKLAVAQGDINAYFPLGKLHAEGTLEKDDKKAVELCTHAAENGLRWAQYNLAPMHDCGRGTVKDEKTALMWLVKSGMVNKHKEAQLYLKAYLQISSNKTTIDESLVFTYDNLEALRDFFSNVKTEDHLRFIKIYDAKEGVFRENLFPIPTLHKAYNALYTFDVKAIQIVKLLMAAESGFMVNCVQPTAAFKNLSSKNSTAVSEVDIDGAPFMLFGHKNHEIWGSLMTHCATLDLKAGLKALNVIEMLYTSKHMKELHELREQSLEKFSEDESANDELIKIFHQKAQETVDLDNDVIDNPKMPDNHNNTRIVLGHFETLIDRFFKPAQTQFRNKQFEEECLGQ